MERSLRVKKKKKKNSVIATTKKVKTELFFFVLLKKKNYKQKYVRIKNSEVLLTVFVLLYMSLGKPGQFCIWICLPWNIPWNKSINWSKHLLSWPRCHSLSLFYIKMPSFANVLWPLRFHAAIFESTGCILVVYCNASSPASVSSMKQLPSESSISVSDEGDSDLSESLHRSLPLLWHLK